MMKAFRRRFIILNLSLAGIVLLAACVAVGFFYLRKWIFGTEKYHDECCQAVEYRQCRCS